MRERLFFKATVGTDEAKDTGMVLALAFLLVGYFVEGTAGWAFPTAILVLVADVMWPRLFLWPARFWFALGAVLGAAISRLLLGILYFGLVFPVGTVRRLFGHDPLQLKAFKCSTDSVFVERGESSSASTLEPPY